MICLHLVAVLFMSHAWPYHFVGGIVFLLVFHGFLIFFPCSFLLCVEALRNWLGKEEVNGACIEMNKTQEVMKDPYEVSTCKRKLKERI